MLLGLFDREQQLSLSPKILGLAMGPQQTSKGWPHVLFSTIHLFDKEVI